MNIHSTLEVGEDLLLNLVMVHLAVEVGTECLMRSTCTWNVLQ